MDTGDVLRKVPPDLQKLVRVVSRAFYQPEQNVVLDILTTYPCVTELDLVDVLKMHGAHKQLRQSLSSLRKDKLIKWYRSELVCMCTLFAYSLEAYWI